MQTARQVPEGFFVCAETLSARANGIVLFQWVIWFPPTVTNRRREFRGKIWRKTAQKAGPGSGFVRGRGVAISYGAMSR